MNKHYFTHKGFGIYQSQLKSVTIEALKKLAQYSNRTHKKLVMQCESLEELDMLEFNGDTGILAFLAEVIFIQENVRLTVAYDNNDCALIFEPVYPWSKITMNEAKMNEETLNSIFTKLQQELELKHELKGSYIQTIQTW